LTKQESGTEKKGGPSRRKGGRSLRDQKFKKEDKTGGEVRKEGEVHCRGVKKQPLPPNDQDEMPSGSKTEKASAKEQGVGLKSGKASKQRSGQTT